MKRKFAEVLFPENEATGFQPGDEAAHRAAAALGDRLDAPTIAAIADAFAFLDRVGGQFHVVTLREKYDQGQRVSDDADGEWITTGLAFFYESRDARVTIAKPPAQAFTIPIADFAAPPLEVDMSDFEPVEGGSDDQEWPCEICGRESAEDKPENPPCVCTASPPASSVEDPQKSEPVALTE